MYVQMAACKLNRGSCWVEPALFTELKLNNVQKWPEASMTVACNNDCECDSA